MRYVCAAVLTGALAICPTFGFAEPGLPLGKPASAKKADLIETPIFAVALVGTAGLAVGLSVSRDGVAPAVPPMSPPTSA